MQNSSPLNHVVAGGARLKQRIGLGCSTVKLCAIPFLVVALSLNKPAQADVRAQHLRCAAISNILQHQHPDVSKRERYKNEFVLHSKWAAWLYQGQFERYKSDFLEASKAVAADFQSKQYASSRFVKEVEGCISLQVKTLNSFVTCVGRDNPTEEEKQRCAKAVVGL